MSRVLIIDDDVGTLLSYKCILRSVGHEVATAALGEDGIVTALRDQYDVVLCDQRLLDIPGTEVVRRIRQRMPATAIVLVTGWNTPELAAEAKRCGAAAVADKPLLVEDVVRVVDQAIHSPHAATESADTDATGYAARRWAELIARAVACRHDLKTVALWCREIGIAHSTLKKRCDSVGVTAKDSLDFIRLQRVAINHAGTNWDLQRRLDIVDDRTAQALLKRAGFGPDVSQVPDVPSFLSHQRMIVRPELIEAIRGELSRWVSRTLL